MNYNKRAVDFISIETLINMCYDRLANMGKTFRYVATKQINALQISRLQLEEQLTSLIALYKSLNFLNKIFLQKKIRRIKSQLAASNRKIVSWINSIIGYVAKKESF
jgi:hypothetical protein